MDTHVRRTPEQVVNERHNSSSTQTTIENRFRTPEQKARVDYHIAKWMYQQGIPFNAIKARTFEVMCESIAQYGSGYIPHSYHQVRVPLLRNVVNETAEMKKKYEEYWKQYRCTLMSDGWTDKRGRHLINFFVNRLKGTYFMGSVDASGMVQSAQMLFELLDSKIDEIGEDYVIQVVTDNASNYKLAGKMLMENRRKLYWTPCAAHCLDLMLEDIGGLKDFKNSLVKHKDALKHLFISDEWKGSNLSKTEVGKKVEETVFVVPFWNTVEDFIRASKPLIVVLRIVDGDERPAMTEVYVAMEEAKKKICEHLAHKERLWKKIINIIDRRWECQIERPLYGATLFLNPGKFFMFKESEDGELIVNLHISLIDVMTRLVDDPAIQDKITLQIDDYRFSKGSFGRDMAIRQRTTINPITWWSTNGGRAFELSKLARRILGLCCSSSSCEHNWSTFEFIHTKKRNRLEHSRLNDLVYVQYNSRLQERFQQRRELEGKNKKYDPLILDELDWSSEWMVT
ncbi:uncharacterized protein LOC122659222 [Telopea speciosissima]|uniref:uncharacterized protein LOC122659222 n=1 Tax=Telopea speciosissima TaxID=54955 RepID=UPI001CC47A16|nr:uncharacterized protein LOC122659222 [Telopea speciosissima]